MKYIFKPLGAVLGAGTITIDVFIQKIKIKLPHASKIISKYYLYRVFWLHFKSSSQNFIF